MRFVGLALLLFGVVLGTNAGPTYAQTGDPFPVSWLALSGNAGLRTNGYNASNISSRQPGLSAEAFANLSAEVFGASTGLDLLYSTESNELRQSMNRFSFNASWEWGRVEAGTVSPEHSQYGLNGATLRGGALQFTPGSWQFDVAAGRSQRAVAPSFDVAFRRAAYARWLYAGSVGVGPESGTRGSLSGTYTRDLVSSLEATPAVRPKENMTLSPEIQISLFEQRLTLRTEVTASVFTPDTRARAVAPEDSQIDALPLTPRVGTHIDLAGSSRMSLELDPFRLETRYERIQPGFQSLGLTRIRGDQETVRVRPQVQLFDNALTLGLTLQQTRNNLRDQRLATRLQRQLGVNAQSRLSRSLSVSGSYMRMVNVTTPTAPGDSLSRMMEQRFVSHTASLSPSLTVRSGTITHTISLTGNAQHSQSQIASRGDPSGSNNFTTTLTYTTSFPSGLSLTASGDAMYNDGTQSQTTSYGTTVSASYAFLERALRVSGDVGWSGDRRRGLRRDQRARQYRFSLNTSYDLPFGERIHGSVRNLVNQSVGGTGRSYRETRVSLRYTHSF